MPRDIAANWLASFTSALHSLNPHSVADLFLADGWLRDVLTLTWDLRALEGRPKIAAYLAESSNLEKAKIKDIRLDDRNHYKPVSLPIAKPDGTVGDGIEFCFTYETWVGPGRGCARLLKDQSHTGEWRAISVGMILYEIRGHEETSFESGIYGGHTLAWSDVKAERKVQVEKDPHVLISEPFLDGPIPRLSLCLASMSRCRANGITDCSEVQADEYTDPCDRS